MRKKSKKKDVPPEPLTRANKKAWAEQEKQTREFMEGRLRAKYGDAWMEDNREQLDRDWERSKDVIL